VFLISRFALGIKGNFVDEKELTPTGKKITFFSTRLKSKFVF